MSRLRDRVAEGDNSKYSSLILHPSSLKSGDFGVKYFFLAEGWTYGRVWEFGGLWNEADWRRSPEITRLHCAIVQQGETLWLYQVEDAIIMVEVEPEFSAEKPTIGQVVLKRLISAEQAIDILNQASQIIKSSFS